jgi:hypothetical protein
MAILQVGTRAVGQLGAGASILAAARTVDTRLIKARLAAFEHTHRTFSSTHDKVHAAEAHLSAAQTQLGELDADQDEAVDALARALIVDGQPRQNPFAAFGPLAPGKLMALPVFEEAKAIHQLVAAVQRAKGLSKPTLQATQATEKAARAVEQALVQIEKLEQAVREARLTRDAVSLTWAVALAALKRGARAAADDGAPNLYATLFDRPSRSNGKSSKPTPAPTPAPAPAAAPPPAPNGAA